MLSHFAQPLAKQRGRRQHHEHTAPPLPERREVHADAHRRRECGQRLARTDRRSVCEAALALPHARQDGVA
eukprot:2330319-Prymnesium_polylepis.1